MFSVYSYVELWGNQGMDLKIAGKKVLIIGASKGIGRGIAIGFAKEKANIVAVARTEELMKEVKEEALKSDAMSFEYEIKDIMECNTQEFSKYLLEKYGAFDIIVHNVGGSLISRDPLGSGEEWNYALKFNAVASIDMNSVLIPPMIEKGWGRVVQISSISGVMLRGNPLYASAKAFLNAYVTTVGRALAPKGVVLSAVEPGAVSFEGSYWDKFVKEGHPRVHDFLSHHQAINRFGTPKEIADVVLFMASEQASFMPGAVVPVDGANM